MKPGAIAKMIRSARTAAGMSQRELARAAGTSQPTVAAYESGRAVPRIETLETLLAASGFDLVVSSRPHVPRGALTIADTAREVRTDLEDGREGDGFRLLIDFADHCRGSSRAGRASLICEPPRSCGDSRFDAAIAALAEFLAVEADLPAPTWTQERWRFAEPWWFVAGLRGFEAMSLRDSPISFARRGVFLNEGAFASV